MGDWPVPVNTRGMRAGRPRPLGFAFVTRSLELGLAGRSHCVHVDWPVTLHSCRQAGTLELALAGRPSLPARQVAGHLELASTGRPGFRTRAGHPERPIKGVRRNALQKREGVPPKHPTTPKRPVTHTDHLDPQPTAHTRSPRVQVGPARARTRTVHRRNTATHWTHQTTPRQPAPRANPRRRCHVTETGPEPT